LNTQTLSQEEKADLNIKGGRPLINIFKEPIEGENSSNYILQWDMGVP
jgi:hypothetical protein